MAEFYHDGNNSALMALLAVMKHHSKPIKPSSLGVIGRDHLAAKFHELGVAEETFEYRSSDFDLGGHPYVVEVAFGYRPGGVHARRIVTGINWSPSIGSDPFRTLGAESFAALLTQQRASSVEPVVVTVHVATPRVEFLDRGKSSVALPPIVGEVVVDLVTKATKKWAVQRKAEERHAAARLRRYDALLRQNRPLSIKEAAADVMESAYLAASANGTLPANPRQIYYAARKYILEATGKSALDSQYFCQTILVDYIEEHGLEWDIAWDDRGHFHEPHTGLVIGLGTLAVRKYLRNVGSPTLIEGSFAGAEIETSGPAGRFGAVLFIEKEGFLPLFEAAKIAERFDVAIMSSKGMSVTAARHLVDRICAHGVRLFVLHDFDLAGFSIAQTLKTSGRRYQFANQIEVHDIGLRLADVTRLSLEVRIRFDRERHRKAARAFGGQRRR